MSKKIHTIQSSDKKEFDKQVNQFLELGGELMDGGYQVINTDDGVVYSQVIVFKKNCEVEFWDNGQLQCFSNIHGDGKLDGVFIQWYEDGQKKYERTYKDGEEDGLLTIWYEDGQKRSEVTYKDGKIDGLLTCWYEDGQKRLEATYKDGKLNGKWISWYENGQKKQEATYKYWELISEKCWDEDGNEIDCDELEE